MSQGLSRSSRMERRAGTPLLALFLCTSMLSAQAQQNAPSTPQAQLGTQKRRNRSRRRTRPCRSRHRRNQGLRSRSLSRSGSVRLRVWPFRTRIIRSMRTDPRWCQSRICRTRSGCISTFATASFTSRCKMRSTWRWRTISTWQSRATTCPSPIPISSAPRRVAPSAASTPASCKARRAEA